MPLGKDLSEGKSQERLAESIMNYIVRFDEGDISNKKERQYRLIGLKGDWGCGKSNLIKIMEEMMKEKYHFFTYDAWGHQEDLQRRSFLDNLTRDLLSSNMLNSEKSSWNEELNKLLVNKTTQINHSVTQFNNDTKIFVLMLLLLGILPQILSVSGIFPEIGLWRLIICLLPAIFFLIYMLLPLKKDSNGQRIKIGKRFKEMWMFYDSNTPTDTITETYSEPEPNERRFREWMEKIDESLNTRLVVVFDNMDRLTEDKVSFASKFIKKTFPIVFRVPEPVYTDFNVLFKEYMKRAFNGMLSDEQIEDIISLYKLKGKEKKVRDIIYFINRLVTYYNQWEGEVKLEDIAIYLLEEESILCDPEKSIMKGKYVKGYGSKYTDTEERAAEIAMLVYGVDKESAKQIPLRKYIGRIFEGKVGTEEIKGIATRQYFNEIFSDEIRSSGNKDWEPSMIDCLSILSKKDGDYQNEWINLADKYLSYYANSLGVMKDRIVVLMKHVDAELAKKVGEDYVSRIEIDIKMINGEELWNYMSPVVVAANEKRKPLGYKTIKINGDMFIDYLSAAKKDYGSLAVATDAKELKDACLKRIKGGEDLSELLGYIKKDTDYADKIRELSGNIVNLIQADDAKKELMDGYFNMLKVVSDGRIVFIHDKMKHLHQEWNTMDKNYSSYIDIYLILAINGIQVPMKSDEELDGIEKKLPYYTTVKEIWDKASGSGINPGIKSIMLYCIDKGLKGNEALPDDVLDKMENVRKNTGCATKNLIAFVENNGSGLNVTKDAMEAIGEKVESITIDKFLLTVNNQSTSKRINETAFWTEVVGILIERGYYANGFTARLKELSIKAINSIVNGYVTDLSKKPVTKLLLNNAKYDDVKATINDVIKRFINSSTNYNKFKFIALHKLIEQIPVKSFQDADKFLDKCLVKILNDNEVLDVIKANSSFYEDLINKNIASTPNLKKKLEEFKRNSQNQLDIINILNKINL